MMNTTYQLARLYVHHCGFSVVPQWHKQKGLVLKGRTHQQRPPSPKELVHWFARPPQYNLAIVPGPISDNLCILDFDEIDAWRVFHALTGWEGPIVRGNRGVHVYVRVKNLPEKNAKGFFEDMYFGDVIRNRSITAPPSVHPSGHVYHWHGDPQRVPYLKSLADIGVECRARIDDDGREAQRRPLPQAARQTRQGVANPQAYAAGALRNQCAKILNALEGRRNHALYLAALNMGQFTDVLSSEQIADELGRAARQAGLEPAEIRGTIRSGLSRGIK